MAFYVIFSFVFLLINGVLISERALFVVWLGKPKGTLVKVFELLFFYLVLLSVLWVVEAGQIGSVYVKGWEFYVITLCLMFVVGFPGFIYQFFWKKSWKS